MEHSVIRDIRTMGFVWETADPFLFCVHHADDYPPGNEAMGPAAPLTGRNLGQDFELRDGWRMYHGRVVPGFPEHPHRGFETVTVVLKGFVDHSDSHGAAGRYGNGDVQWMTAGSGLQHAEMFPLLDREHRNPLELFQIWLNLPAAKKFARPHFRMLWAEDIPVLRIADAAGIAAEVTLIAGSFGAVRAPAPAPDSWAADPGNGVAIMIIRMEEGGGVTLPDADPALHRTVYCFEGADVEIEDTRIARYHAVELRPEIPARIRAAHGPARVLLLQGRPIGEPVAQYGPFVMNSEAEIKEAFHEYQRTQFGGWPWQRSDQVHPRDRARFARYADGREETPGA